MQSRRYLSKLHSKHKKKFFLRIFKSYTFVFQIIIFSKYFSLFHIFPNILFTALFIIHSLIPHCTILSNTFRIFFLQFFYISLFTLHPLHSYFFFFFKFQAQYSLSTNFTIPARFHKRAYIFQIYKFPNKKSPFRNDSFHEFSHRLLSAYNTPSPCHKPSITFQAKKKKKNPSLQIFMTRSTIVINHRTIALNTDTSPIYVYIYI